MSDTATPKVVPEAVEPPSFRAQALSISLVTVAFLIMTAVIASFIWPIERYESAPGRALSVMRRLSVSNTDRPVYEPDDGIRFVTALGTELTALQSFMGWVDPYVGVLTCEQRFGRCEPGLSDQIQLGAMATAKEIAAYVALSYVGIEATLVEGPAQVAGFDADLCPEDAPDRRACRVLEIGDVIVSVDVGRGSVRIDKVSDLGEVLSQARPGDVAELVVRSFDQEETERRVDVELLASPEDPNRTLIGFNPRDTRTVSLPFDIDIDTASIGGPSAGLSFTLALIDLLTPGDLMPSGGVAATGTISAGGEVGPIGFLVQKLVAVKQSGVRYFIVPESQGEPAIEEIRRIAGDDVVVIVVGTLDEAIDALVELGGVAPPSRADATARS
ncbi:MAG: S16 family serine protease [Actinomycetota bacterium]